MAYDFEVRMFDAGEHVLLVMVTMVNKQWGQPPPPSPPFNDLSVGWLETCFPHLEKYIFVINIAVT